jgi:hypothetical protein
MAYLVVQDIVDYLYREIGTIPVDRQDGTFPMVDPNQYTATGSYLYESHGTKDAGALLNSVTGTEELDRSGNLVRVDQLMMSAINAIRKASSKVQMMEMWFNTYPNVEFTAVSGTRVIMVPGNLLTFQNVRGGYIGIRAVPSGVTGVMGPAMTERKFIDRRTQSDQLDRILLKSVTYEYTIDELPYEARELIAVEAAVTFVAQQLRDSERVAALEKEAHGLAVRMKQLDVKNKGQNIYDMIAARGLLGRMVPWRGRWPG